VVTKTQKIPLPPEIHNNNNYYYYYYFKIKKILKTKRKQTNKQPWPLGLDWAKLLGGGGTNIGDGRNKILGDLTNVASCKHSELHKVWPLD
jgi:hypothetical protein